MNLRWLAADLSFGLGSPAFLVPEVVWKHTCGPSMSRALFDATKAEKKVQALRPPITAVIDGWALRATLFCPIAGDTPFRTCVWQPRSFHCTPCSATTHARLGMRCKRTRRKSKDRAATRRRTRGPSKRRKHSRSRGCCGEICAWVPRRPAEFE